MPRIFVSATTKGLKSYRLAVAEKLRSLGHDAVLQDEFPMVHTKIAPMLADQIAPCDAVVLLIGPVFGAKPADWPEDLFWRSYTQLEYDIALEMQKPVFRFIATDDCPLDPYDKAEDPHHYLQVEYVRGMADFLFWTFDSQESLLQSIDKSYLSGFSWHNMPFLPLGSLFKGRNQTLTDLHSTLVKRSVNKAVITANQAIHGLGGVGKTRLAIEYAYRFASEYSARLYVKADTPESLRSNLANLITVLKLDVLPEQQYEAVRHWLRSTARWLLIFDNVDTTKAKDAVDAEVINLTNGHVLITSRMSSWQGVAEEVKLDVLDEQSAVEFLMERTDGKRSKLQTDDADAKQLADDLGFLPLALEQAGAFIATNAISFGTYCERWKKHEDKVLNSKIELLGKYPHNVYTTWSLTFEELSTDGRGLLHTLCWLAPAPIPVEMILKIQNEPNELVIDAEDGIANLVTYSLLSRTEDKRSVSMHRLVQEITEYRLPEEDRLGWLERSLKMVNSFCVGEPHDVRNWQDVYTPARPHLFAITAIADKANLAYPTTRLMNDLSLYLHARFEWTEAELLIRRALEIDEQSFGPDHPNVARILNNLAMLLKDTNRLAEAESLIRRALTIDKNYFGTKHSNVARDLNNLALILEAANRLAEAEPLMRDVINILENLDGKPFSDYTAAINNLAKILQATNRLNEAELQIKLALKIDELNYGPDHPVVAIDLNNLMTLLYETNRLNEAEPLIKRALKIDELNYGPDHPNVARDLNNLAELYKAKNRLCEAEPLCRRALEIWEKKLGEHHPQVATASNNLAQLLQYTKQLTEAEQLYCRALEIWEEALGEHHPQVATALNNLAQLLQDTNRLAEAEPLMRRHLVIFFVFKFRTGHPHPHLQSATQNYTLLLQDMGRTESEIEQALAEVVAEASHKVDSFEQ